MRTSGNTDRFIELKIENDSLLISGIMPDNEIGLIKYISENVYQNKSISLDKDGSFKMNFKMDSNSEMHRIEAFKRINSTSECSVFVWDILKNKEGKFYFNINASNLKHNRAYFEAKPSSDLKEYLKLDGMDEYKGITDLAREITAGKKSGYDKLSTIYDWITQNIIMIQK